MSACQDGTAVRPVIAILPGSGQDFALGIDRLEQLAPGSDEPLGAGLLAPVAFVVMASPSAPGSLPVMPSIGRGFEKRSPVLA